MKSTLLTYIDRFRHDRKQRIVFGSFVLVLAVFVAMTVYWQLHLNGIAMTNATYCGYEEHVHTEECYEKTLVCELEESEGHTHTEECYEEQSVLVCELEESEGHAHTEDCYDEEGNLICGLEESEGHTHTDECYETQSVLICELEESEGHTHTDECYEYTLICGLEEHTHTAECMVDETADLEDYSIWEATIPALTGDLRTDVVNIAYSQLGYTESVANYVLGEDGVTHMGYTRYGTWYGSSYSDWDSMFVAFCLDYAGIADEFTYNAGAYAWSVDLTTLGYYQTADVYTPSVGDVVFIDTDDDGKANVTAIVVAVDETAENITVIQGNYAVEDLDGDTVDTVSLVTYSTVVETEEVAAEAEIVSLAAEYGIEETEETEDEEITPVILGYADISYGIVSEETEETEETDEDSEDETEEDVELDEDGEELTEEVTEEVAEEAAEEVVEEVAEEVTSEETGLLTASAEEETEEETVTSLTYEEWSSKVISLYTAAMSAADATEAYDAWDALMVEWDSIDAALAEGTITEEEWSALNALMETYSAEVYTYFTETLGYDPYGIMTLEETASNSATDTLYTDLNDSALANSTVSWTASNVSYDDGKFTMELVTDFIINSSDVTYGAVYYVYLPEDFSVSDDAIDYKYTGTDSNRDEAFHYYFEVDSNGNYYIKIVFDIQDYVDSVSTSSTTLIGKIDYTQYTIKAEDVDDSYDEGYVVFDDTLQIKVSVDDVDHDDDDSWILDINVKKTAASYDSEDNSITYTVVVSSTLGTGETITISDILSLYNNLSYTDELSIDYIEVDSVTYQVYTTNWTDADYTTDPISYNYTHDGNGLTITLPQLYGADDNGTYTSDRFEVKYTVYFKDADGAVSSSVINKATGESTKDGDTQSSESSVTVNVTSTNVGKKASFDSSTGYITWTITYNANSNNIAGNSIVDTMLADAVDNDVTVTSKDSTGTSTTSIAGDDYTINYDSDGNITSIVFNAIDEDGDGTADGNTRTYTITYQTPVSLGTAGEISNEVDVYDDGEKIIDEGESSTYINGFGKVSKSVTAGDKSSDGNTRVLNWTSNITVPATGISAGTTIADYLKSKNDYTSLSSTMQWFTYDQLKALMDDLATISVTKTTTTTETDPYTGEEITTTVTITLAEYVYGTDYSIKVYGFTSVDDTGTGTWIDYATIAADPTAYSDYVFTAWQITLLSDFTVAGDIELNYSSTIDISNVTTYQTYENHIYVGEREASAGYTERNTVYKTDGNGNSDDTTPTVTDGVITWKVNISVDGLTSDYGGIVITESLPIDVSLQSLEVALGYTGAKATLSDTDTVADGSYTLTFSYYDSTLGWLYPTATVVVSTDASGQTTLTITVPYDVYTIAAKSSPYLYLTIQTKIDGWDDEVDSTNTYMKHEMNNKVSVTLNGEKYGEDEQQQTVEHEYVETGTVTEFDHDEVEKSADMTAMGKDNLFDYEVLINLDGETLNSGNDLTLTDALFNYDGMDAELVYSSVHFYYLYELDEVDNGDGTYNYVYYTYTYGTDEQTGEETKTVKSTVTVYSGVPKISTWASTDSSIYIYTESDKTTYTYYYMVLADIAWDYEKVIPNIWWPSEFYLTFTATVPDRTPLLFTYTYYITCTSSSVYLSNTATLSVDGSEVDKDQEGGNYNYQEPTSSGTISNAGGLTVIKSGEHTSDFIEGTTFALYKYNSSSGEFEQVYDDSGEAITYTTNSSGSFTVIPGTDTDGDGVIDNWYKWYSPNTLYYLIETSTPTGYLLDDDTKYYFYWYDASDTADPQYTAMAYPSDWDSDTEVSRVTTTSGTRLNIYNTPITSFNLKKVSTSDGTTPIEGAVFALYEWSGARNDWVRIGTFTTDSKGEIVITFDEDLYEFNRAYRLVEITPADGYNIGYNDVTEFYFWWNSSLYPTHSLPDNWGDDSIEDNPYAVVYDIAAQSEDVTATNTKTSTMATVTKAWVDTDGNVIDSSNLSSNYSATVQLYYYLLDSPDGNGNAYSTSTSTSTELITISSTSATANTDVVFYSLTPTQTLEMTGTTWYSLSNDYGLSVSSLISAMSNSDYDDLYIEVEVSGGDQPTGMQLILQAQVWDDTESKDTYPTIASVTPWTINTVEGTTTYTAIYRVSKILSAIQASGYSVSNIVGVNLALNSSQSTTVTSFEVVGAGSTAISSLTGNNNLPYTSTDNANSVANAWIWVDGSSSTASVEAQDGAVIALKYSGCTVSGDVRVGIQFGDGTNTTSYYKSVTIPTGSGTVYVSVADFTTDGGASISGADWSYYNQTYVQLYNSTFVGTVDSLSVVLPATSSSSYKTYYVVYDDPNGPYTCYLNGSYPAWVGIDGTANSTVGSYLQDDDAVIRVYYTADSDSETLYTVIQSWASDTDNGYMSSDTVTLSKGSSYVDFYLSDIKKNNYNFSWDSYNKVQVAGTAGVTVTDIKILLPYDVTQAVTGVIPSDSISVTLYDPDFTAFNIYNGTVNGTNYGNTNYNLVVSTSSEAASGYTYSYSDINKSGGNELRGFTFLDAIYSDLDSTVQITVTLDGTYSAPVDMLSHLDLIILGDLSTNYTAIADVAPNVEKVSGTDNTYILTYSSSEIVAALAGATAHYSSAAEACADYDTIYLALSGSYYTTSFSATVTDIDVVSTVFNTSDTYTYSNLLGTSKYGGTPYYTTDDAGNTTYYTATLDSSNNWTYSYANLPISFYDSTTGTTWYYYYYFVETESTGSTTAYTTTYSQTEGENGGGEIVILNIETSYVLPSAGGIGTKTLYEFGAMLILLALVGVGAYYNISRMKNSLVTEPRRDTIPHGEKPQRVPNERNRKFVSHRTVRRGDSRAGPDEDG